MSTVASGGSGAQGVPGPSPRLLHVAAEVFPLVKTGGLADVVGALPPALVRAGADVRLLLPGFPAILESVAAQRRSICEIGPLFGAGRVTLRLGQLPGSHVSAYLIDAPYLYRRVGGPYQDSHGMDWPDNLQRFALLGWMGAHLACGELDPDWMPEVLHAHDWHAGLACAYAKLHPGTTAATVFTVHNLAYQGLYPATEFAQLGLPQRAMASSGLEFHGQLSFMKGGLKFAERVTTVSPSYAREIATQEFGAGLDGVIRSRMPHVSGILNGVDPKVWDPAQDTALAMRYDAERLEGKAACKEALQREMGLEVRADAPLLGVVSRLTSQKGLDLVLAALPSLLWRGAQLVVVGTGDHTLEAAFREAAAANAGRIAVRLVYDEVMAHRVIGGADAIMVPSRFEPCGLTQLYALRYGTVPLVRRVGGLADTVVDVGGDALHDRRATGFAFDAATPAALEHAIERLVALYREPARWREVMRNAMAQDFSWDQSAEQYLALYRELLGARPRRRE